MRLFLKNGCFSKGTKKNIRKSAAPHLSTTVLFIIGIILFATANNRSDAVNYKREGAGIERDQFGRIIKNSDNKKKNYPRNKAVVDITGRGNSNEKSISYLNLLENAKVSHDNVFSRFSSFSSKSLSFEEDWKTGIFGSGIGKSGINTADIDNDGKMEIVAGGSTSTFGLDNFWYIIEHNSASQTYEMHWISDIFPEGITNIAVFNVDNSTIFKIFIGLSNGDVHVYDGSTMEKVGFIDSPAGSVNRIKFADGDNDSFDEIIFCDDGNTFFYDYDGVNFSLKYQIPYGSSDFEIGNVDSDPSNEIVLVNGLVLEFNGVSTSVEWDYSGNEFGYLVELSDIDSDGMEEIIGASSWYYITAFDADIQSLKWQIQTDLDIDALLVTDVDNDGIEDLLYGDGQWGNIYCYDVGSVTQKWQIDNPDHGVTDIAVFDTDADGDLEVLWGAGASSSGADHLYIHGIPTLSIEWQSQHIDGPFNAIDVGDVDADGQQEIVVASFESNSGYDDGIISIYDATTHALEWQSEENMFGGYALTGIHALKIGDVDDDNEMEIVVGTDRLYNGALYIINGITHDIEQSYYYDNGAPIYSIAIADVDNDDHMEIVAGGGREHTGAPGVFIYVIDGATGVVEWHSISLGDYWSEIYSLAVGDIDNDGVPEIVGVNDSIFVFDGISHQQWQSTFDGCYGLDLYDTDNDGIKEIIVGTENGNIVAIDGQTFIEELSVPVSSSPITSIRAYDFKRDGNIEISFTSADSLWIYSIVSSSVLWKSYLSGSPAGEYNNLIVADIDSDERTEIITGTNYTVVEFEETADEVPEDPVPDVKANENDEPITILQGEDLNVTIALDPGSHEGEPADWWVVAIAVSPQQFPSLWWFTEASGWIESYFPIRTYAQPLVTFPPYTVLETSTLPVGKYTFFFAVDDNMNGVLDATYLDLVLVTVKKNQIPNLTTLK